MPPIPIQLAVEDELSESVVRRLLISSGRDFHIGVCYRKHGFGYLKKRIAGFNLAATITPFFVLTDLDERECPPTLIRDWLAVPRQPRLLLRVAVREIESWLLADHAGIQSLLSARKRDLPENTDSIEKPKEMLIRIARRNARREIREAIVPRAGSTAKIGRDYNGALGRFVRDSWAPVEASRRSESLTRAIRAIGNFQFEGPQSSG